MAVAQILPGVGGDRTEELKERRDRWVFPLSLLPGGLIREKKLKATQVLFFALLTSIF